MKCRARGRRCPMLEPGALARDEGWEKREVMTEVYIRMFWFHNEVGMILHRRCSFEMSFDVKVFASFHLVLL